MRSLITLSTIAGLVSSGMAGPPDPQELADRIDARIDSRLKDEGVPASAVADDAEFLRRAYLDLTGRIPLPSDVYGFLSDDSADKRGRLIDELLETPRHASHMAAVWRDALAPETASLPEARVFRPGFEAWLRLQFRANTPYDRLARELLTAPLSGDPDEPTPVLRRPNDPNPLAFFAVKEAKPENLAAVTTRVFLGVQIECAQCHDHPFGEWTREQFWNQAAFFAGLDRSGDGLFAPIAERNDVRDIQIAEGKKRAAALFLDEQAPSGNNGSSLRGELAAWVTSKENSYFARTAANRVWGLMFGLGIVDPVDDFHDDNPPSHPELLDDLADALVEADFDLRYLIRAIGRTKAYQRTSAMAAPSQSDTRLLARMPVKGLTGEQLYDSLLTATGVRDSGNRSSSREQFLTRFTLAGKLSEPETSIPQALALMNGRFTANATTLATSPTLTAACDFPGLTIAERVEMLYLSTLSRKPTAKEQDRIEKYVAAAGTGQLNERLADLFWVLINSAEFRLNH